MQKLGDEKMFEHIDLKEGIGYGFRYNLYPKQDVLILYCSKKRLDKPDFDLGLCHELVEATLRLVVKELENYWKEDDDAEGNDYFHNATLLSLPKYEFIAWEYDFTEKDFEIMESLKAFKTQI